MPNADVFNFKLIGKDKAPFVGYNSQQDPTKLSAQYLVEGSKNVFLNNRGNVEVRPGLKRIGPINTSINGVVAETEFETSKGVGLPIWVLEDGTMQFYYEGTWHDLATFDKTRFVFSNWWDDANKETLLVMVNGDHNLYAWSGALVDETGPTDTGIGMLINGGPNINVAGLTVTGLTPEDDTLYFANNLRQGANAQSAIVIGTNPSISQGGFSLVIDETISPDGNINVEFVPSLVGLSPTSNLASVLIGTTREDTMLNLFALFADPGSTTTQYVGITDIDTINAIGVQTFSAAPALETGNGDTWASLGFLNDSNAVPNPTLIVDGITYSYSLITDRFMLGLSGTVPEGEFGFQGIVTTLNTPADDFSNDFIVTLNNQLVVGSYMSKVIHISFDENYTLYTQSNDLIQGDPDFAVLDEFPTGAAVKGESVYVFAGNSNCYVLTPNTAVPVEIPIGGSNVALVITTVDKQVGTGKSAAISQEFITTVGESIIYLSQDHQLRTYGTLRNITTPKTPSLSKVVRQELIDTDFTGGGIRSIDEFVYIVSPLTGKAFLYQMRDDVDNVGNLTIDRLWQPPQDYNFSRVGIIDGIAVGFSSVNPQAYQIWDTGQWHDDSEQDVPSPYEARARFAYQNNGLETGMVSFNMCYYEGYLTPNSELNGRVRFDYLGGTKNDGQDGVQDIVISSNEISPLLFAGQSNAEVGVSEVGTQEVGGTTVLTKGYPKFRLIQDIDPTDVFEYQNEVFSYSAGSHWELQSFGVNATQSDNNPVFIRKA